MSLSVGAVNNLNQNANAVSFGQRKANKAKNAMVGTLIALSPMAMNSCDKDEWLSAKAVAVAVAENNNNNCDSTKHHGCGCDCHGYYIKPDTIVKHDSIPYPVIVPGDTVYIKDDYKSPVIDTLNVILDDVGVDKNRGYVPLRVTVIDEMDNKYRRNLFDGRSSGIDQVVYRSTRTPFNDALGRYIVGSADDDREAYFLSLTQDGRLYATHMVPKAGTEGKDSLALNDYMMGPDNFVFDRDRAAKLVRKFSEARGQAGLEYAGTYEKGDLPKSIMITNPYGTQWRYTDVNVISGDPYKSEQ